MQRKPINARALRLFGRGNQPQETCLDQLKHTLQGLQVETEDAVSEVRGEHLRAALREFQIKTVPTFENTLDAIFNAQEQDEDESYERAEQYRRQVRGDYYFAQLGR